MSDDPRLYAPSTVRNRDPILTALRPHLPAVGLVLEIASGTGEHVAHFAAALPSLHWQPTDPSPERRASIDAWTAGLPNVGRAIELDAASDIWPVAQADVILCINMIHIAPWSAAEGLISGAGRLLPPGGLLALYGPYRRRNIPMEPGNAAFDADLRDRDVDWGLRELETVVALAATAGLTLSETLPMPANNLTVLFRASAHRPTGARALPEPIGSGVVL